MLRDITWDPIGVYKFRLSDRVLVMESYWITSSKNLKSSQPLSSP